MLYADIITDISHARLDRSFQYSIPDKIKDECKIGSVVNIPFGRGDRIISGFIIDITDTPGIEPNHIKEIISVASDVNIPEIPMIDIARMLKETYGGTMVQALRTVLPVKTKERKKEIKFLTASGTSEQIDGLVVRLKKRNATARLRLLEALKRAGRIEYSEARRDFNATPAMVKALEDAGVIKTEKVIQYRNQLPYTNEISENNLYDEGIRLTAEQACAKEKIISGLDSGENKTFLVHGVTGSGKTHLYLEVIEHVVKKGMQAIVLIPEIALTRQTLQRFYSRFAGRVSVINSRMSKGERYDRFLMAAEGEIDVIIGPRSALFTPFSKLGLIVIDEEHEDSYRSETVPRFHATLVARFIAERSKAGLILGSATPSVESYYKAIIGEYELITMKRRAGGQRLPDVYIEDMREELRAGNKNIFSRRLIEAMKDRIKKHEQIMLFINKRGYAGFISCRSCGHVIKCPHCDLSLTFHRNGRMVCHTCGYDETARNICPKCGSRYIAAFRAGTQQIETKIRQLFPEAVVLRMDKDTTSGKDGHAKILSQFASGKADILIGTQMIVKGHDFPKVTLVAALAADMSLFADDYRASERTFQLLTQAAGRAGRGQSPGEMYIQTYTPENSSIKFASEHDYEGFFKEEIKYRKMMMYPPIWSMLTIHFSSFDEKFLLEGVNIVKESDILKKWSLANKGQVRILGPSRNSVYKREDEYRMTMVIKCANRELQKEAKRHLEDIILNLTDNGRAFEGFFVRLDVD